MAGRRRAGLARGQGSPAAPDLAAVAAGPAQELPAACAGGRARRPRQLIDVPVMTTPGAKGKGVREREGLAGKLTVWFNRAEKGRKVGLDGGA